MDDGWVKMDLHSHSHYSYDGLSSPAELVKAASRSGIRILAVTDHGTVQGGKEAQEFAMARPELNVQVIVGQEVYVGKQDVVALFVYEDLPAYKAGQVETALSDIHEAGGLVYAVHPFGHERLAYGLSWRAFFRDVDAVEIHNACPVNLFANRQARTAHNLAWIDYGSSDIPVALASSDAHSVTAVGSSFTWFNGYTPDDLHQAIQSRRQQAFRLVRGYWSMRATANVFENWWKNRKNWPT